MTTYANITQNYQGFKRLFGEDAPEKQVLHFLNSVVTPYDLPKIKSIIDLDDIPEPLFRLMFGVQDLILIHAQTEYDEEVIIQLDLWHLYYGRSFCYLNTSDKYAFWIEQKNRDFWDKSIIHIALCEGFSIDETLGNYQKLNNQKGFGDYHLIRLNLPFYNQKTTTDLEQWLLLITAAHTFQTIPESITTPEIQTAFANIELSTFNKLDLDWYLKYEPRLEERRRGLIENSNVSLEDAYLKATAKQPKFSVVLLEKAFGLYPKQVVVSKMIDTSMVKNQNQMAFNLFRLWTKKVNEKYPERNIIIKDETPLLKNFESSLVGAILSLFNRDNFLLNDFDIKYAKDFVTGYVCSQLSVIWEFEYIVKNNTIYKRFQALQAVLTFFDQYETKEIMVDSTYYEILQQTTNLDNINPIVNAEKLNDIPENANGQVRSVLTDLRDNLLKELLRQKNENFEIEEIFVFDDAVWDSLVEGNKGLFV